MSFSGILFSIITIFCWGGASFVDKIALTGKLSPAFGVAFRSIVVASFILPYFLVQLTRGELAKIELRSLGFVALSGLLASLIGQWALYSALKGNEVSRVVPVCSTYPVVAAILGFVLMGEAMTIPKVAGLVMVTGGVVLLTR